MRLTNTGKSTNSPYSPIVNGMHEALSAVTLKQQLQPRVLSHFERSEPTTRQFEYWLWHFHHHTLKTTAGLTKNTFSNLKDGTRPMQLLPQGRRAVAEREVAKSKVDLAIKSFLCPLNSPNWAGYIPVSPNKDWTLFLITWCEHYEHASSSVTFQKNGGKWVFIPKAGKSNYSLPKSYYPVSPSSWRCWTAYATKKWITRP